MKPIKVLKVCIVSAFLFAIVLAMAIIFTNDDWKVQASAAFSFRNFAELTNLTTKSGKTESGVLELTDSQIRNILEFADKNKKHTEEQSVQDNNENPTKTYIGARKKRSTGDKAEVDVGALSSAIDKLTNEFQQMRADMVQVKSALRDLSVRLDHRPKLRATTGPVRGGGGDGGATAAAASSSTTSSYPNANQVQHVHYHYHYQTASLLPEDVSNSSTTQVETSDQSNTTQSPFDDTVPAEFTIATCQMRANYHIPLLNQQDISGQIKMWQRRSDPSRLFTQIRLKGFKVMKEDQTKVESNMTFATANETDYLSPDNVTSEQFTSYSLYGMHVHESSDLSRDCQSTGAHYNPFNVSHGGPQDSVRHLGDWGNIAANQNGFVQMNMVYSNITLTGELGINNRSIVIRNQPDDFADRKSSNPSNPIASVRIACCAIRSVQQYWGDIEDFLRR